MVVAIIVSMFDETVSFVMMFVLFVRLVLAVGGTVERGDSCPSSTHVAADFLPTKKLAWMRAEGLLILQMGGEYVVSPNQDSGCGRATR